MVKLCPYDRCMKLEARRVIAAWLIACPLLILATSCGSQERADNVAVDRFETRVALQADGSADVEEVWALKTDSAAADAATSFRRRLPDSRHDGLTQVTFDGGATLSGDVTEVNWTLAPNRGARTTQLRYRATGIVEVSGLRGTIAWRALAAGRHGPVAAARMAFSLPTVITLASEPRVVEPGWQIFLAADGTVIAERANVASDEGATLVVDLIIEPGSMARSQWQEYAERGRLLMPAFVSGGLLIVVVGVAAVVMVLVQIRSWTPVYRAAVVRGLSTAGLVTAIFGVIVAITTPPLLGRFGSAPMAIPASILFVGILLVVTSWCLRRFRLNATRG
jgi:hypothetical protein